LETQDDEVRQAALVYLEGHHVMTLATSGVEGVWAAAVFYVSEGFDLYFLSAGHTRHGQNLAADGRAAATIQEDYHDWPGIKGIQLEGVVTRLEGEARQAAIERYVGKYPFVANPADERMRAALVKVNWYRLRPERLYLIDNSKGLGHRDEIKDLSSSEGT
jgi:uncharacterized protein YhbP (UPF0306 family)